MFETIAHLSFIFTRKAQRLFPPVSGSHALFHVIVDGLLSFVDSHVDNGFRKLKRSWISFPHSQLTFGSDGGTEITNTKTSNFYTFSQNCRTPGIHFSPEKNGVIETKSSSLHTYLTFFVITNPRLSVILSQNFSLCAHFSNLSQFPTLNKRFCSWMTEHLRRKIPQINHLKISINNSHQIKNSPLYTNNIHFNALPLCAGFLSSLFFSTTAAMNNYSRGEKFTSAYLFARVFFVSANLSARTQFSSARAPFANRLALIFSGLTANWIAAKLHYHHTFHYPFCLNNLLPLTLQRQNTTIWSSQKC